MSTQQEVLKILPKLKPVDQGTIVIKCIQAPPFPGSTRNFWEIRFPDDTVTTARGKAKAFSLARSWFQARIGAYNIGIGKIERHT